MNINSVLLLLQQTDMHRRPKDAKNDFESIYIA